MKVVLLFFSVVAFIVLATKFAQFMLKRVDIIEKEIETKTNKNEGFKEVLKKDNCSSTTRPNHDYNDKQNLTKFNHGTYRDQQGRFKSNKKFAWKKEQETS